MITVLRLARADVERMLRSKRLIGAGFIQLLVAYLASSYVRITASNAGVTAGALDVHAAALNSWALVNYLLLVAFLFLVGDTVISDRMSGWAWLTAARSGSRSTWWLGKALAVGLVAVAFQLALLIACTASGVVRGGFPLLRHASRLATTPGDRLGGMQLFATLAPGTDMLARQAVMAAYETAAFTALALVLIALTARLRHASLPAGLGLGYMVVDYLLVKQFDAWAPFSIGRRLLESTHSPLAGQVLPSGSWAASLMVIGLLATGSLLIGARSLSTADL